MIHSLFEPSIARVYPCEILKNSVDAGLRNHVMKFSKFFEFQVKNIRFFVLFIYLSFERKYLAILWRNNEFLPLVTMKIVPRKRFLLYFCHIVSNWLDSDLIPRLLENFEKWENFMVILFSIFVLWSFLNKGTWNLKSIENHSYRRILNA